MDKKSSHEKVEQDFKIQKKQLRSCTNKLTQYRNTVFYELYLVSEKSDKWLTKTVNVFLVLSRCGIMKLVNKFQQLNDTSNQKIKGR